MRNAGVNFDCFVLYNRCCILRNRAGRLERFLHNWRSVSVMAEAVVSVRQLNRDGYFFVLSGVHVFEFCRRDGVIRVGRQTAASDAAGRNGCVCRAVVGALGNGGRKDRVGQINPLNGQLHGVRRKRVAVSGDIAAVLIAADVLGHRQLVCRLVKNFHAIAEPFIGCAAAAIRFNCCREFYRRAVRNCRFSIGRNRHGAKRQDFHLFGRIRCKALLCNVALCLPAR